ncbi:unnamed protein product, partial [marine sediment metagenome]
YESLREEIKDKLKTENFRRREWNMKKKSN